MRLGLLSLVAALALSACSNDDSAKKAGTEKDNAPAETPKRASADVPVDVNDRPTPPQGGTVIAKMQASKQELDLDPPTTLSDHISATMQKIKSPPKVECKSADKGHWHCTVWPGKEFSIRYEGTLIWQDGWRLVDGSVRANGE